MIRKGKNNSEFTDSPTVFAYSKLDADKSWDSDSAIIGADAGRDRSTPEPKGEATH